MNEKKVKVNFNFKVEEDIKDRFVSVCKANDSAAAQELRKFMKDYLQQHSQQKMFS